jgi:HD-GYP domain-containing protein (c-di-GMP phosphodiesterase class II)/ABC-type amino acid transport substrate-binding protein
MPKPISIRINLLTYFFLVVGIVAASIIGLQYFFSVELAESAARDHFESIAKKTDIFIENNARKINKALNIVTANTNLINGPVLSPQPEALSTLAVMLNNEDNTYSAYYGNRHGDFYQLINLHLDENLKQHYQSPQKSRWLLVRVTEIDGQRIKYLDFLDENLQTIEAHQQPTDYDPRNRPWYLMASYSSNVIVTEIYRFSGIPGNGVSYAKKASDGESVVGIDIALQSMQNFLKSHKSGLVDEVFMFDRYGYKYLSSDAITNKNPDPDETPALLKPAISFTQAEQDYLSANPVISVSNETDWAPMDFIAGGTAQGLNIDIIRLIGQKTGLRFNFINGFSWSELVQLFKDGKIDLLHSASWSAERDSYATISKPMSSIRSLLVTRAESTFNGLNELTGKVLAMPAGWTSTERIRNQFPDIKLVTYPNQVQALLAVEQGQADATIASDIAFHFNRNLFGLNKLVLGPWLKELDDNKPLDLYILTQKNNPVLSGIIAKALDSITEQESERLKKKWTEITASAKTFQNVPDEILHTTINKQDILTSFTLSDTEYLGFSYSLAGTFSDGHYLGMRADKERLMAPYMKKVLYSVYAALLIAGFSILLILYVTSRIIKPINQLMVENSKISERRYQDIRPVDTIISEFLSLSDSLIDMSRSIQDYEKQQEELLDSFIRLIAEAIDTKSPYTGGHCERVPEIAKALARVASDSNEGPFKDFKLTTDDDWREFHIGSWLHDCGKITTPEYVVDKATKLETISNRIHEVRMRFEVLWRDAELIAFERIGNGEDKSAVRQWLETEQAQLQDDFAFVADCNIGGEFMGDEKIARLQQIAQRQWLRYFDDRLGLSGNEIQLYKGIAEKALPCQENLLSDRPEHIVPRENFDSEDFKHRGFKMDVPEHLYNRGELYNLTVRRGTLTDEERFKINDHVIQTIRMLEKLPLPKQLKRVPEYAGTHHETLIGTGYPRKLTKDELSVPARIMALADIFEALTASDRPYKKAKTLSEAIKIMSFMVKDHHIDAELFALFLRSGLYLQYAEAALKPEQIDQVDIEAMINS